MSDGNTNTALTISGASATTTATGSFVGLVNEWAVVIGFLLTIASLIFAVYSHRQTMQWRREQDDEKIAARVAAELAKMNGERKQDESHKDDAP